MKIEDFEVLDFAQLKALAQRVGDLDDAERTRLEAALGEDGRRLFMQRTSHLIAVLAAAIFTGEGMDEEQEREVQTLVEDMELVFAKAGVDMIKEKQVTITASDPYFLGMAAQVVRGGVEFPGSEACRSKTFKEGWEAATKDGAGLKVRRLGEAFATSLIKVEIE